MNIPTQFVRVGPLRTPSDTAQLCKVNIVLKSSSYRKTLESDTMKAGLGLTETIKCVAQDCEQTHE